MNKTSFNERRPNSELPKIILKPQEKSITAKARFLHGNAEEDIQLNENLLNFVTEGLEFHKDVLKETCAYVLPYDPIEVKNIYKPNEQLRDFNINFNNKQIEKAPKTIKPVEIRDDALVPIKHFIKEPFKLPKFEVPQVFIPFDSDSDVVVSTKKFNNKRLDAINSARSISTTSSDQTNDLDNAGHSVFITEADVQKQIEAKLSAHYEANKEIKKSDWDDFVISKLSENTATWIVVKQTEAEQKEKLMELIENKFGKITKNLDDIQLIDEPEERKPEVKKEEKLEITRWKSDNEILLNPTDNIEINQNDVPLYRLPRGIRQQIMNKEKFGSFDYSNNTVLNVEIDRRRVLSPQTYKDRMQNILKRSNTIYNTNNKYELEMIDGNNLHYSSNPAELHFDNGKTFQKVTQSVFPEKFTQWINGDDSTKLKALVAKTKVFTKGHKRWTDLPKNVEEELRKPEANIELDQQFWYLLPIATPDHELNKLVKANNTLSYIVQEWRRKWQIGSRWACAEIDELIKDMKDIHANVRFQAVVVCSRAAEFASLNSTNAKIESYKSSEHGTVTKDNMTDHTDESDSKKDYYSINTNKNNKSLPEKLFVAIECLLNDPNEKVKLAAAITLFAVDRDKSSPKAKDKAEAILRETLDSHNLADRQVAAQCLASHGICEFKINLILLKNYFNSLEEVTREQVIKIIADLSRRTTLINSMIGEYLNSDDIRHKIFACKILPCLKRPLNRDLTNKLVYLMWNDPNKTVKKVAAQTLGRTGRGQYVHDEIFNRLQSSNTTSRIEALKRINYLGIMTVKLLPPYLKCFKDEFITVREVACIAAQRLIATDEKIILSLIELAQYDEAAKIKACAIQTLGLISKPREDLKKCLLWAVRFESNSLVRAEACNSLVLLYDRTDSEVVETLHDRYLIEQEPYVKEQLSDALKMIGFDPKDDIPIMAQIKNEVRRLNNKELIWNKINKLEKDLKFEEDKKRFIHIPDNNRNTNSSSSKDSDNRSSNHSKTSKKSDESGYIDKSLKNLNHLQSTPVKEKHDEHSPLDNLKTEYNQEPDYDQKSVGSDYESIIEAFKQERAKKVENTTTKIQKLVPRKKSASTKHTKETTRTTRSLLLKLINDTSNNNNKPNAEKDSDEETNEDEDRKSKLKRQSRLSTLSAQVIYEESHESIN